MTKYPKYQFTTSQHEPEKVIRIQLELVDFTVTISTKGGDQFTIDNQKDVQSILDQAKEFNRSICCDDSDSGCTSDEGHNNNRIEIEIKLDPINSVNTYHIPA